MTVTDAVHPIIGQCDIKMNVKLSFCFTVNQ